MKKVLILILIVLLIVLGYNIITSGYKVLQFDILSIKEIQEKNEELDTTIAEVEELKNVKYPAKISELNTAAKSLLSNKKTYEELAAYSSEQDVINAAKTQKYDIEVLWVSIGNHAEKDGVIPKLEILSSSNNTVGANDLRITATGSYIGITDFVKDIEDDSKLGFVIENFELVPSTSTNGSNLQATFKIKDIFLNPTTTTTTSATNKNNTTNNNNTENNAEKEKSGTATQQ